MREDVAAERERLAAEAFERIRGGQHWRDWTMIAQGLEVGRNRAMLKARTNEPVGRGYNEAFASWMDAHPWTRKLDKATRNHLFWVADHLLAIEAWRETLPTNQRDAWNHPTTVKRAYERAHRMAEARDVGEPVLSPMAQMKAALVESEEAAALCKRRAEEGGSLFDLRRGTPQQIARVLVESCTISRCEAIAKAIRDEVKRQKQAHAG
jgi:hypothetical protein